MENSNIGYPLAFNSDEKSFGASALPPSIEKDALGQLPGNAYPLDPRSESLMAARGFSVESESKLAGKLEVLARMK